MQEQLSSFVADRIKELRKKQSLTLDALAAAADVSKAMVSRIERNQVGVTIEVLSRISEALGVSISDLLDQNVKRRCVLQKIEDQPIVEDNTRGFSRRTLSPTFSNRSVEFVRNELAPGGETGVFTGHRKGVEEHIYVVEGELQAQVGDTQLIVGEGECLFFEANVDHSFKNTSNQTTVWLLVMSTGQLHR